MTGKERVDFILQWSSRMMNKTTLCGVVTCEALYYACEEEYDEEGNPGESSITMAKDWEKNPDLLFKYIRKSGKWCMAPTWGCYFACKTSCEHIGMKNKKSLKGGER